MLICKEIDGPPASADQVGCLEEERRRDGQAERLSGLEVDDQLEGRGLFHWQVSGLGALEDFINVDRGAPPQVLQEPRPSPLSTFARVSSTSAIPHLQG